MDRSHHAPGPAQHAARHRARNGRLAHPASGSASHRYLRSGSYGRRKLSPHARSPCRAARSRAMPALRRIRESEARHDREGRCRAVVLVLHCVQSVVARARPRRVESAQRFLTWTCAVLPGHFARFRYPFAGDTSRGSIAPLPGYEIGPAPIGTADPVGGRLRRWPRYVSRVLRVPWIPHGDGRFGT